MKKITTLMMAALALSASAQSSTLTAVKPTTYGNPLTPIALCADPTAIEYEGRLYVYGTYDQQEYEYTGGTENNGYGHIGKLIVLSTTDMVNWTNHGTINVSELCSWCGTSWAPSIVSRVEDDGLTHFYMYFVNNGGSIGVITATDPLGPWTDPLKRIFIAGWQYGISSFDPGAVIDDNGVGWLTLGGLDPIPGGSALYPGNSRIVRLGADMISLDSDFVTIPAPYHFEANELNYINGKMVFTYCSSWSARNDWAQYSTTAPAPGICSMCYLTADNPLDANSWQWGGEVLRNPSNFGYPGGNNHSHMHKYAGKYYIFYHTQCMEPLAGIRGGYRSLAVDEIEVDEENVKIFPGKMTNEGVSIVADRCINALERQQAETFATGVGFKVSDLNTPGKAEVSDVEPGGWMYLRQIDFGEGANTFTAKIRGTGKLLIKTGRLNGKAVGTLDFANGRYKEVTVTLDRTITGKQNVYFVFEEASSTTKWDEWQFSLEEVEGITDIKADDTVVDVEYYSLDGRRLQSAPAGLSIKRSIFADGTSSSETIKK